MPKFEVEIGCISSSNVYVDADTADEAKATVQAVQDEGPLAVRKFLKDQHVHLTEDVDTMQVYDAAPAEE